MTAETLKPFLNIPSEEFKRNNKTNFLFICFSLLIGVLSVLISLIVIWNISRTNQLENEVELLKQNIEEIKVRFGYDILRDLNAWKDFEYEYNRNLKKGDIFNDSLDDDLINDENDEEDEEDDDDDDDIMDEFGSGDYEDELEDLFKNRKTRSITTTNQGVPIINESYFNHRKNHTKLPRIMFKHKTMEKTSSTDKVGEETVTMMYDWNTKDKNYQLNKKYESLSPNYMTPLQHKSHIKKTTSNNENYKGAQNLIKGNPVHNQLFSRNSRVMSTNEDKSKAFRQVISKQEYARLMKDNTNQLDHNFMESVRPKEGFVSRKSLPLRRSRRESKNLSQSGHHVRNHAVAIHFVGDSSKYRVGTHPHYYGNGRIRHHGGIYIDWATPAWTKIYDMDRYFEIHNGLLLIKEPGVYYIYAQIFYHNNETENAYHILHNSDKVVQCTVETQAGRDKNKSNSCYTGLVKFLDARDTIAISDTNNSHVNLLKSFFGVFKVGDVRTGGFHN